MWTNHSSMGRVSSVVIATRYGMDGPGIETRWGARFSAPVQTGPRTPTQPPVQWVPGLSREVKRPGRGADPPPLSQRRVHERVGLYLYLPSGLQWPVIGRTILPFRRYISRESFRYWAEANRRQLHH